MPSSSGSREHPLDTPQVTHTERAARIWLADDKVTGLREWATETAHNELPARGAALLIGAHASADLRLTDPHRKVSRRHGRLIRDELGDLYIEDLESRNGIYIDGVRTRRRRILISPGTEVRLGSVTLVAENATLIRLRHYLARILGWQAENRVGIEHAIRAIRATANHRGYLWLAGEHDLVAVARQLHLRGTLPGTPFVVCGPRKHAADGGVRVTATVGDASEALRRAAPGMGTICVRADELPKDYEEIENASRDAFGATQLYLCVGKLEARPGLGAYPIVVPTPTQRSAADRVRIIEEYALDAMQEFGAGPESFNDLERAWIFEHEVSSYADVEVATTRVVACNAAGNPHQAAAWLGLSHAGLGGWFARRPKLKR